MKARPPGEDLFSWAEKHPPRARRARGRQPWTAATGAAVEAVELANGEFIERCLGELFRPDILGLEEFVAGDVTNAAVQRGYQPTDWRAVGPLMLAAVKRGLVAKTGNMLPRTQPPTGHTSREHAPAYRLTEKQP